MNWKKLFVVTMTMIFAIGVTGCGGSKETARVGEVEQLIRYNGGAEPETLDPAKMTGLPEGTIANALFEGMTRYDSKQNLVPGMAKSWTISPDQLVYTFKLRDAEWSNGDPVTAEDFKFAWLRALDPEMASDYAYQLYYIKGAEAYNSKKGKAVNVAIKVVDPKTLEVTLAAPTSQFLGLTAFQTLLPLNKKVVEAHKDWHTSAANFVSNGPFRMENWKRKQKITLVKNDKYWDAKAVKLKKLEIYPIEDDNTAYTMFKTGKLEVDEHVPTQEIPRLKNTPEFKVFPDTSIYFYRFNVTKKPFDNPKVRKALAMAIERTLIVEKIAEAGQKPAFAFVPYGFVDADGHDFRENAGNAYFKENISEAKKLLAEAGYPGGKGFPKTSILFNTKSDHQRIAEAVQAMWKKNLGIDIGITNKEWQVFLKAQQFLDYDISRSGWSPDYLDPISFIDMFVTDGGNNNTGWSNARYDALVKQSKATGDSTVRMKAMHDAEALLMEEMPITPIYFYTNPDLIKTNVKGLVTPPFGLYKEFKWAYVE